MIQSKQFTMHYVVCDVCGDVHKADSDEFRLSDNSEQSAVESAQCDGWAQPEAETPHTVKDLCPFCWHEYQTQQTERESPIP